MKPYDIFWQWFPLALTIAEVTHPGARKAMAAIRRLRMIEGYMQPDNAGQTGYLENNDPYQALEDYIAHVYDGAPAPFWLRSAEHK